MMELIDTYMALNELVEHSWQAGRLGVRLYFIQDIINPIKKVVLTDVYEKSNI